MTKIEWTHFPGYKGETWQVTHGCRAIAAGCENCYAIRDAHRMAGHPNPKISGPRHGLTRRRDNGLGRTVWTGVVRTAPENLAIPLRWKAPRCIFVNSNSDLFHEAVPFEFIAAVYGVMAACPQHRFIILTKRPKRMREFMAWLTATKPHNWDEPKVCVDAMAAAGVDTDWFTHPAWPLPNVIHGYSAANQADLDAGIADLLATPSALRCLSLEPLIGPVTLADEWLYDSETMYGPFPGGDPRRFWPDAECCSAEEIAAHKAACAEWDTGHGTDRGPSCATMGDGSAWTGKGFGIGTYTMPGDKLDWVIIGGESGPGARPCDVAWIRSIVEQCKSAGVACFTKQLGKLPAEDGRIVAHRFKSPKCSDPSEWPADLRVRQWPEVARG